ncbi:MAG: hypothetical protein IPP64_05870 [Bacteroidetes bacterium]|nr:hypothetical protein [Bacteroidota bacterium]
MPGYVKWESEYNPGTCGLKYIDHMVGNVELGEMNNVAKFYEEYLLFQKCENVELNSYMFPAVTTIQ